METWIIYVAIYAALNGVFECSRKKSIEKNSIYEVLMILSVISFILAAITCKNVLNISGTAVFAIFIKALAIVISWVISLHVMSKMPISLYSVISLSKIVFATILSLIFLGEVITIKTLLGILIVILGLVLVNKVSNVSENKEASFKSVFLLLCACLLSAIAGILDKKVLMHANGDQMQFWFLLFLAIMLVAIFAVKNRKLNVITLKNNYWILITALSLVIGDKFLFAANEIPESKVTIITIVKQLATIETIILGKIMFKEKQIVKKLLCSILIILGIAISVI